MDRAETDEELLKYLRIYQNELFSGERKLSWWRCIVYGLCSKDQLRKLEEARLKRLRAEIVARELAKEI